MDKESMSGSEETASSSVSTLPSITGNNEKYGFSDKVSFDADKDLWQHRSDNYARKIERKPFNIFLYPPENFIAENFAPKPPKRNSREANKPENYTSFYIDGVGDGETIFRDVPHKCAPKPGNTWRRTLAERRSEPTFKASFRLMRPFTAKRLFATEGSHPREQYKLPQPFDHRGLKPIKQQGIPEFDTNYEKDPYAIKAHSRNLHTILGNVVLSPNLRDVSGPSLAPPLFQPPKWESRLHLPHDPFPLRYAAYTRYREKDRDAYVAFMDTVDERLTKKWKEGETVTSLVKKYGPMEYS